VYEELTPELESVVVLWVRLDPFVELAAISLFSQP
jgi:hypothetical protein